MPSATLAERHADKSQPAERSSDAELVILSRNGSARAFAEIMRRYNRRLYRTARSILKADSEAEDVVQETYLQAYQNLDRLAEASRLSPWLLRIAANKALDRLRRRGPVTSLEGHAKDDGLDLEMPVMEQRTSHEPALAAATRDDPEAQAARREIRGLIETAIDELPQAFRAVFVLRALEELTTAETAACLGIPVDTVKTRFHRAKRDLRRALDRELDAALAESFPFAGRRCDRIVAVVLRRLGLKPGP